MHEFLIELDKFYQKYKLKSEFELDFINKGNMIKFKSLY
jgi:hypothetical protein